MTDSARIEYLRWARAQAFPPHPEISLILSGMTAPEAEGWEVPGPDEMFGFLAADHPPLAHRLAEAWRVPPEQVLVQPGTHYSIELLLRARLSERPGPVVVETPAYEPLVRIPEALGAEVLRLPRRGARQSLDLDALEELHGRQPSVLVLSHPHNPSGAVLGDEEVDALRRLQEATGCAVLSDEVYLEFLEDPEPASLLHRVPGSVILRSFTKVFGLGGMRCTGIAGDAAWIAQAIPFTDHGTVAVSAPSHAMALRVWDRREELWARARHVAAEGRAVVAPWLEEVEDLLTAPLFDSGIICFCELRPEVHEAAVAAARRRGSGAGFGFGLDGQQSSSHLWIDDLRRGRGVQLTPGAFFENPRAFRLGFGVPVDTLREGLARVESHLRSVMEEA